ncbi:methyltransferase [Mycobacteroides abscessus subsp. abscessus]|uniref:methyltransferase n=1 Tax=Mycobacteroides abscessus TaxID=36809 RepID=UPI00266C1DBB|nr:methyltransferase [Mycobacteroides abscessus]MDO3016165.1 methyltransferase [Mycobacteroides abscessus subsp. abscessus]
MAESTTENLFREFYGASTFVEKRDIPKEFGFQSKREGSRVDGFPDFFKEMDGGWLIVVEAKSGEPGSKTSHAAAEVDVVGYMSTNAVPHADIIGIAVSGQTGEALRVTHFFRKGGTDTVEELDEPRSLVSLKTLAKHYDTAAHFAVLDSITSMTRKFEVGVRTAADWEQAILEGHRVFRELVEHQGGAVTFNADRRELSFSPPDSA